MSHIRHLSSAGRLGTAALLAVICLAGSANAAVIISNLNGNDGSASTLVGNLDRSKAVGFTLPAIDAYQLDSVVVRLDVGNTAMTISAAIYGSSAGLPAGSPLVTFTIPALANGTQNLTLTPTAPLLLQPSTTYFLVLWGTSTGSTTNYIDWLASSPAETPTGVATYAGAFADNTGAVTVPPTSPSATINSFSINATLASASVPEPATLSMTIIAIVGLFATRQRFRR